MRLDPQEELEDASDVARVQRYQLDRTIEPQPPEVGKWVEFRVS
jgi:hypothetical protein